MYANNSLVEKTLTLKQSRALRLVLASLLASVAVGFGASSPASAITPIVVEAGGGTTTPPAPYCISFSYIGDYLFGELRCTLWSNSGAA